jgi:hypothetical protein
MGLNVLVGKEGRKGKKKWGGEERKGRGQGMGRRKRKGGKEGREEETGSKGKRTYLLLWTRFYGIFFPLP